MQLRGKLMLCAGVQSLGRRRGSAARESRVRGDGDGAGHRLLQGWGKQGRKSQEGGGGEGSCAVSA